MDSIAPQLILLGVLIAINAVFAGSEIALISLREAQLQRLEERSRTGRRLAELARDPNRFLATIQVGITLAGFLASAFAAVPPVDAPFLDVHGQGIRSVVAVGEPVEGAVHLGHREEQRQAGDHHRARKLVGFIDGDEDVILK